MAIESKEIKDKEFIDMILNITEKDITSDFIYETFGEFNGVAKYRPYDILHVPPGHYGPEKKKNKNSFTTTLGLWVYNKFFIEQDLFDLYHYINHNINSKFFDQINKDISYALLEDDITLDVFKRYLEKTQIIMPFVTILSGNHTEKILTCTEAINKKKAELAKKYRKQIDEGDPVIAEQIEKELLQFATDYMGDDPSMDSFLSGARGSIKNNFKNMYVMKGAVKDPDPNAKQEYQIALSNYMDGISKDEYALYAKSLSAGPYSRGKKTQGGGYWENLFMYGLHHLRIDNPGTDCGTKRTITVTLTKDNISKHMYNYIVSGSNLVELTTKNKDKYIGKTVKMRYSALCEHEVVCSKCAGNFFYRLGGGKFRNVGATTAQIPSVLKNKAMKAFHDSTVVSTEMDPMEAFGLK